MFRQTLPRDRRQKTITAGLPEVRHLEKCPASPSSLEMLRGRSEADISSLSYPGIAEVSPRSFSPTNPALQIEDGSPCPRRAPGWLEKLHYSPCFLSMLLQNDSWLNFLLRAGLMPGAEGLSGPLRDRTRPWDAEPEPGPCSPWWSTNHSTRTSPVRRSSHEAGPPSIAM